MRSNLSSCFVLFLVITGVQKLSIHTSPKLEIMPMPNLMMLHQYLSKSCMFFFIKQFLWHQHRMPQDQALVARFTLKNRSCWYSHKILVTLVTWCNQAMVLSILGRYYICLGRSLGEAYELTPQGRRRQKLPSCIFKSNFKCALKFWSRSDQQAKFPPTVEAVYSKLFCLFQT